MQVKFEKIITRDKDYTTWGYYNWYCDFCRKTGVFRLLQYEVDHEDAFLYMCSEECINLWILKNA